MAKSKVNSNQFWNNINQKYLSEGMIRDIENFKSNDVNFTIALWNPKVNGVRYLKTLLYNLCTTLSKENWQRITKIRSRNIGNPFTVQYNNEEICLDYLQAVHELEFISGNLHLDGLNILEIGAGYGRTCHAIMSNCEVKSYLILDLKNCLYLSQEYLKRVLKPDVFSKIIFVTTDDFEKLEDIHFDLCINIDSFAEMDLDVIKKYLGYINANCHYIYVKNPVGKYMEKSMVDHSKGEESVELALNTGILRDVIDISDNQAINLQVPKFIKAYQPGSDWVCIGNSWAVPWSYYWQAMYKKISVT